MVSEFPPSSFPSLPVYASALISETQGSFHHLPLTTFITAVPQSLILLITHANLEDLLVILRMKGCYKMLNQCWVKGKFQLLAVCLICCWFYIWVWSVYRFKTLIIIKFAEYHSTAPSFVWKMVTVITLKQLNSYSRVTRLWNPLLTALESRQLVIAGIHPLEFLIILLSLPHRLLFHRMWLGNKMQQVPWPQFYLHSCRYLRSIKH